MNDRLFRNAMSKFATGITIVTIDHQGKTLGMTVNAFMSISLNPKLIAISIDKSASMYDALDESDKFGVSILTHEQQDLSMVFARQKEKDKEICYFNLDGVPVLEDALTTLSCRVHNKVMAGDHLIYIAEVTDLKVKDGNPTIFFNGDYRSLLE